MSVLLALVLSSASASPASGGFTWHGEIARPDGTVHCGGVVSVPVTKLVVTTDGETMVCTGEATLVYDGTVDPMTGVCVIEQSTLYPPERYDCGVVGAMESAPEGPLDVPFLEDWTIDHYTGLELTESPILAGPGEQPENTCMQ